MIVTPMQHDGLSDLPTFDRVNPTSRMQLQINSDIAFDNR